MVEVRLGAGCCCSWRDVARGGHPASRRAAAAGEAGLSGIPLAEQPQPCGSTCPYIKGFTWLSCRSRDARTTGPTIELRWAEDGNTECPSTAQVQQPGIHGTTPMALLHIFLFTTHRSWDVSRNASS